MKIQIAIATLVFNLLVATNYAIAGTLDAYIPVSPVIASEVESAPIPDVEAPTFKASVNGCTEEVVQIQKCERDYLAGLANEDAYQACTQKAKEVKLLCLRAADHVAYVQ